MTTRELANNCECTVGKTSTRTVTPRVNAIEKADAYHLEAEMPGVSEKEVEVELKSRYLRIAGNRDGEEQTTRFQRALRLPEGIDGAKVEAKMANGILYLTIPKSEAVRPRTIKVKAG